MSADEIRGLADLRKRVLPELWQAILLWPEHWEKVRDALLAYAAMVERCEKRHADPYGISDDDYNYILTGATDERK